MRSLHKLAAVLALLACACDLRAQEVGQYPLANSPLLGNERLLADQGGNTVNITPAQLAAYSIGGGGILGVPFGGTGIGSLTGLITGNGTAPFSAASAANVYSLFGCSGANTYLNGAGGCTTPSGAGTVTTTGLPAAGNIAAFSGTTSITAATAPQVVNLFSGCSDSASQYLASNGTCQTASGSGTVTSVGLTAPGIFTVSGSPVTGSGTIALLATGTSGGIPYFSSSSALSSSAALIANELLLGGGAGNPPTPLGSLGTTTTVYHGNASGAGSFGSVVLTTDVSSVLPAINGGTGIANSNTITLGSNFTTSGTGPLTVTTSGATSVTLPVGTYSAGFLGLPPCTAASNAAAQACPLTAGTTILGTANSQWIIVNCGSACTQTIPLVVNSSSPAFVVGTCLVFQNVPGAAVVTVAPASGVTLTEQGTGSTGNRTLTAPAGMSACMYATNSWIAIPGGGVS